MPEFYDEAELEHAVVSEVMQVEAMTSKFLRHGILVDRSIIHAQPIAYDALGHLWVTCRSEETHIIHEQLEDAFLRCASHAIAAPCVGRAGPSGRIMEALARHGPYAMEMTMGKLGKLAEGIGLITLYAFPYAMTLLL